jgi:hypothetical protein
MFVQSHPDTILGMVKRVEDGKLISQSGYTGRAALSIFLAPTTRADRETLVGIGEKRSLCSLNSCSAEITICQYTREMVMNQAV